ncbi:hypothetical protein ACIQOV_06210 [Kitasatospora sp. NPDC091257]|uniref:hypothetical protein n=1 Tax=Kitasatospora sp. NPDC091257 TaxID=3364084 RepID=UPI003829EAEB
MKRLAAVLAGTAALAALTGTQTASAATASVATASVATASVATASVATASVAGMPGTTVCGDPGAPNHLTIRACINNNGGQVYVFGRATPTSPTWQDQQVSFRLTSVGVTSPPLGTIAPTVLIPTGGSDVGGITGTVPCGRTVTAQFSVDQPGWPQSTATVSTIVNC